MSPEDLLGAWALADFTIHFADGRSPWEPFGPGAQGLIVYDATGWMSATLCRAARPPLDVPRLEAFHRATDAEKAGAFDSYLAYAGRWHLEGDTVVHTVVHGLLPNIVGQEQRRNVTLDGDDLTLSYRGGDNDYVLRWRRACPSTTPTPNG